MTLLWSPSHDRQHASVALVSSSGRSSVLPWSSSSASKRFVSFTSRNTAHICLNGALLDSSATWWAALLSCGHWADLCPFSPHVQHVRWDGSTLGCGHSDALCPGCEQLLHFPLPFPLLLPFPGLHPRAPPFPWPFLFLFCFNLLNFKKYLIRHLNHQIIFPLLVHLL